MHNTHTRHHQLTMSLNEARVVLPPLCLQCHLSNFRHLPPLTHLKADAVTVAALGSSVRGLAVSLAIVGRTACLSVGISAPPARDHHREACQKNRTEFSQLSDRFCSQLGRSHWMPFTRPRTIIHGSTHPESAPVDCVHVQHLPRENLDTSLSAGRPAAQHAQS